ncbi:threonyl-tRNA synthetase-like protein [Xylariales sp. PMI_506]|nr:threonyl-tRNA synthetase-like protein [Xylariales sp. PMI_506]
MVRPYGALPLVRSSLSSPAAVALSFRRACSSCPTTPETPKPSADHRQLGVQQELFTTSIYSPGSPILLPSGATIFNRLVDFLRKQYVRYGFQEVITPTIYKKALWAKSGHLENYAEDMFTVTSTSPSRRDASENAEEDEYGLKPMNCPGHCLIFASQRRSYRDLPIRYADFSPLHRNEISGALSGLTRVRRFHQDDGHIFCRPSQIEEEIKKTLDFVRIAYEVFKLGPYRLALSTRPADHYIGTAEEWESAEGALKRALDASGKEWTIKEGDGAFYGPKIDIVLTDSDGKEHQTATIQLDFQLPKRFNLEYHAPAPELERRGEVTTDADKLAEYGPVTPVLIHRAVLGSVERLMALLIEHYNGKWPFWLNPRQVMIATVNDSEPVVAHAQGARDVLLGISADPSSVDGPVREATQLTVDIDDRPVGIGAKVREAKAKGYGIIVVAGSRQLPTGTVSVDTEALFGPAAAKSNKQTDMLPQELLKAPLQPVKEDTPNYPPPDYVEAAREHGIPVRQSGPIRKGPQPFDIPILKYLKSHRVILASASPRRRALLGQLGLTGLEVRASTKPEDLPKNGVTPYEYVSATANQKAMDVYTLELEEGREPDVVIAADTVIVTRDGRILEKPPSEQAHIRMLKHLRDTRVHRVMTAVVCIAPRADASHPGYSIATHTEETKVYFAKESDGLPDEVIESYVRTREGVDKAGGYAIQGMAGMVLVEKVEGSVDNVVGLPVRQTLQLCEKVVFKQNQDASGSEEEDDE